VKPTGNTDHIARTLGNTPTDGFIQRSVLSKLATASETLSTAVMHTDRAGIRCFAGLSPSIQLRPSMRSVLCRVSDEKVALVVNSLPRLLGAAWKAFSAAYMLSTPRIVILR
jgi:hypothetical protein